MLQGEANCDCNHICVIYALTQVDKELQFANFRKNGTVDNIVGGLL